MKITVLGCGTSTGVPVIGCKCNICISKDIKNKRMRSSLFVTTNHKNIIIDTSTDLRQQALVYGIERIDAVLYTHPHADHIHGIDELRSFNMIQKKPIPCYGSEFTMNRIRYMFDYIFTTDANDGWKPELETFLISAPFDLFGLFIQPVNVYHGKMEIFGYKIGRLAYITDCSQIPDNSKKMLDNLDVLILGALRHKPHPTHLSIEGALQIGAELKPKRVILTHLSHNLDYAETNKSLPKGFELAYDGMEIEIEINDRQ
ncbi:MAG: MBL fold metallo-hydrolase [Deltaproteobacteria bacterium]|nr:MBL fold metallo-hydrolase [Deltaproteobacteria bacterium]MBI3755681.1 MBL fold metallo-hydrolase [Deltaproteobacteria bacterium]